MFWLCYHVGNIGAKDQWSEGLQLNVVVVVSPLSSVFPLSSGIFVVKMLISHFEEKQRKFHTFVSYCSLFFSRPTPIGWP